MTYERKLKREIEPVPGTVLEGTLLVLDYATYVRLSEVRGMKQGSGMCHFYLTGGVEVVTDAMNATEWAPILARILADRDTDG